MDCGIDRCSYFDPPWIPGFMRRNEVKSQTRASN